MNISKWIVMLSSLCACAFGDESYTDNIRPEGRVVGVGTIRKAATVYGDLVTTATEAHALAEQATADLTSGLALKVDKAGDTMTGALTIQQAGNANFAVLKSTNTLSPNLRFQNTVTGSGATDGAVIGTLGAALTLAPHTGGSVLALGNFGAAANLSVAGIINIGNTMDVAIQEVGDEMLFKDTVANGGSQIKLAQLLNALENGQSINISTAGGTVTFSIVNSGSDPSDNVVFYVAQADSGYDLSMAVYPDNDPDSQLAGAAILAGTTSALGMKIGPDQGPVSFYTGAVNNASNLTGWVDGSGFHSPSERWRDIPAVAGAGINGWSDTPDSDGGFIINLKSAVDGQQVFFPLNVDEGTTITQIRVKWEGLAANDGVKFSLLRRVESPFTTASWTVCGATQRAVASATVVTTYDIPDVLVAANTSYAICVESEIGTTDAALYSVGYATTGRVH